MLLKHAAGNVSVPIASASTAACDVPVGGDTPRQPITNSTLGGTAAVLNHITCAH